jgi:hypothetical protein
MMKISQLLISGFILIVLMSSFSLAEDVTVLGLLKKNVFCSDTDGKLEIKQINLGETTEIASINIKLDDIYEYINSQQRYLSEIRINVTLNSAIKKVSVYRMMSGWIGTTPYQIQLLDYRIGEYAILGVTTSSNEFVEGTAKGINQWGGSSDELSQTDKCLNGDVLQEGQCVYTYSSSKQEYGYYYQSSNINCKYGCLNGACKTAPDNPDCIDKDGGKNYYTAGEVTKNGKKWQDACAEDGMTLIERYCDSNGNPSYEEYSCYKQCKNGACPKIENTTTQIESETITSTETITTQSENTNCNGCLINESCVSFGYRINGKYCHISKEFINQKNSDEKCENHFECLSDACVSQKCIDSGFIQKLINWFKALFGS